MRMVCGYRQICCVVWVGFDDGSSLAAGANSGCHWTAFMTAALGNIRMAGRWEMRRLSRLTINQKRGAPASDEDPEKRIELVINGISPQSILYRAGMEPRLNWRSCRSEEVFHHRHRTFAWASRSEEPDTTRTATGRLEDPHTRHRLRQGDCRGDLSVGEHPTYVPADAEKMVRVRSIMRGHYPAYGLRGLVLRIHKRWQSYIRRYTDYADSRTTTCQQCSTWLILESLPNLRNLCNLRIVLSNLRIVGNSIDYLTAS